jgi:uridine kinase
MDPVEPPSPDLEAAKREAAYQTSTASDDTVARALLRSPLFWAGAAAKLIAAALCGSHFATRWFAPFLADFVRGHFADPWAQSVARGEPLAFPYGPLMAGILSLAWLPALAWPFDPSGHLGLLLLRLPLLAADLGVLVLLVRWLEVHVDDALRVWWLSPLVFYATYVHGQLDLLPTAMLCLALFLLFRRRLALSAVVFGGAIATKGHVLLALPLLLVLVHRQRLSAPRYGAIALGVGALPYAALLPSAAFRAMVLGSQETGRFWAAAIPFASTGLLLHLCPAALTAVFLRFASYRRVNRELTLMFVGGTFLLVVALSPPQPGWFLWSYPFVAYVATRLTRRGRAALAALSLAYLGYFLAADPTVFLESLDPTLGAGTGARLAGALRGLSPWLAGPRAASAAFSVLFAITALLGFELYRVGVRGSAIYDFLDVTFMLGIGGDSGSGKHTLGNDLRALVGDPLTLLHGDDDHRWERGHAMWQRHTHLDPRANLLLAQVEGIVTLRQGGDVWKRRYDHADGRFTAPIKVRPTPFVAIVGLHPFYLEQERRLLHLRVFVDTDEGLRRAWKVARDVRLRGYSPERVLAEIERRAEDSARFVHPQRAYADVVVRHLPGADASPTAVSLVVEMATALDTLHLLETLTRLGTLVVTWSPDATLTRDTFSLRGEVTAAELSARARLAVRDIDSLLGHDAWRDGGRGVVQLVLLHAIAARLRFHGASEAA